MWMSGWSRVMLVSGRSRAMLVNEGRRTMERGGWLETIDVLMKEEKIIMMIFPFFIIGFVFGSDIKGDTSLMRVYMPTVDD